MSVSEDFKAFKMIMSENPVICFSSQSGSGKGTQVALFQEAYKKIIGNEVFCMETGELFRKNISSFSSFFRDEMKSIQEAGKLQSHEYACHLWRDKLFHEYEGGPIVIDGSPRSVKEAAYMQKFFIDFLKRKIFIFNFQISDQEAIRRIQERNGKLQVPRTDTDTPEKIMEKLGYFDLKVYPALVWMSQQENNTLININAMASEIDIHKQVIMSFR